MFKEARYYVMVPKLKRLWEIQERAGGEVWQVCTIFGARGLCMFMQRLQILICLTFLFLTSMWLQYTF